MAAATSPCPVSSLILLIRIHASSMLPTFLQFQLRLGLSLFLFSFCSTLNFFLPSIILLSYFAIRHPLNMTKLWELPSFDFSRYVFVNIYVSSDVYTSSRLIAKYPYLNKNNFFLLTLLGCHTLAPCNHTFYSHIHIFIYSIFSSF